MYSSRAQQQGNAVVSFASDPPSASYYCTSRKENRRGDTTTQNGLLQCCSVVPHLEQNLIRSAGDAVTPCLGSLVCCCGGRTTSSSSRRRRQGCRGEILGRDGRATPVCRRRHHMRCSSGSSVTISGDRVDSLAKANTSDSAGRIIALWIWSFGGGQSRRGSFAGAHAHRTSKIFGEPIPQVSLHQMMFEFLVSFFFYGGRTKNKSAVLGTVLLYIRVLLYNTSTAVH